MAGSHLLLSLHQGDATTRIRAWEIRLLCSQHVKDQKGISFFLFVFSSLIKMILVSELPPIVKTTQKPNVYSGLIIIFLSCD